MARRRDEELRPASDPAIDEAISKAYDDAAAAQQKPPNLVQLVTPVQAILKLQGVRASTTQIQKLARADEHKARRLRPGIKAPKH